MSAQWDIISQQGYQFFGKMSASISHEIKNTLAIISENVGLLQDFLAMAEKGKPLDQKRLRSLSEKVMDQVRRADHIVRDLNRFAHSADEAVTSVDVTDMVRFLSSLCRRLASMRGITLDPKPSSKPLTIETNPFLLENLVWLCLDFAMDATGEENKLSIICEKAQRGARIRFTGLKGLRAASATIFPDNPVKVLLQALEAELHVDNEAEEITLTLPGNRAP